MKTNIPPFFRSLLLLFGLSVNLVAHAQLQYAPVPVTGFTDDVVANIPGPANQSATNDMDGGNNPTRYCFLTQNYRNPAGAAPTTFLPANGLFTSAEWSTPGLTFQLADYNANNTLRIKGIGTGTLTFVNPRSARILYLLGGSGNSQTGPTNFEAVINFTDGTTQTFPNVFFNDWFGMLDVVALQGVSRVNFDTNVIENSSTDPSLYQKPLAILPANYGKLIRSIDIFKPAAFGTLNVLAVSAGAGCTTAPAGGQSVASHATICAPTNVSLSLTGAGTAPELTYQWQASTDNGTTWTNISGATTNAASVTPTQTTQYRARLLCGARTSASTSVTVTLLTPAATIDYLTYSFCQLGKTQAPVVTPTGGTFSSTAGLAINNKTGQIDLEASEPGLHKINYTSPGLCPVQAQDSILILAAPKPVFPNIITPDGDGRNDLFIVKLPPVSAFQMRLYNRWGNLIWENTDPKLGWSGDKDGIYFYLIQIKDCAGNDQTYKGWVEVVH